MIDIKYLGDIRRGLNEKGNNLNLPKKGYKVSDSKAFQKVRNYLVKNGYSTKNFDNNLESIVIEKSDDQGPDYIARRNNIKGLNLKEEELLAHETLHMASNNFDNTNNHGARFDNNLGEFLDEGLVELMMFDLYSKHKTYYYFQTQFSRVLLNIYNNKRKAIMNTFFIDNQKAFYTHFGKSKEVLLSNMRGLDEYHRFIVDWYNMSFMKDNDPNKGRLRKELLNKMDYVLEDLMNSMIPIIYNFAKINKKEAIELAKLLKSEINRWSSYTETNDYSDEINGMIKKGV